MNALSLLIYAIELVSNLNTIFGVAIFIGGVATVVSTIVRLVINYDDSFTPKAETIAGAAYWNKFAIAVLVVGVIGTVFIPSRQTAIMIAASEVSEVILKTETAQNVMKDVTGLSSDAVGLLKNYIQSETKKLSDELNPPKKETADVQPNKT